MRWGAVPVAALTLASCGSGVITSEDVSGGEAVGIAIVMLIAFVFVGIVITRKK